MCKSSSEPGVCKASEPMPVLIVTWLSATDLTREIASPSNVILPFDAFGRLAINHPQHPLYLVPSEQQ